MSQDDASPPGLELQRPQAHAAFTPAACADVLRALRIGVEAFRQAGVVLPRGGWIEESASCLELVVARGTAGETDADLRRTSAAVAWAVDLYHIGTCLSSEMARPIAAELGKITRGRPLSAGDASDARDYKNFLSQFWVGALLAQSSLSPRVLAYDVQGAAKPDFLIESGRVTFAVEVKRPSNWNAARRCVEVAGGQIRTFDRPGFVIIDATDCMSFDPFEVTRGGPSVGARVGEELGALQSQLVSFVERYSRSNKFHQVTTLMTFARYWSWVTEGEARRDAGLSLRATALPYRWSHQMTGLTRRVQDAILGGLEQLTGNPPEYSYS